jgi:hypothetical protein
MFEVAEAIANEGAEPFELWCEPWAESIRVAPGKRLTIVGTSLREGRFEVERKELGVVIYAWPGSTVIVYDGETVLRTFPTPVPDIPRGMSTKGFVGLLFGQPRHPAQLSSTRKAWWKLW